jgi:hypothetical protein
VHFALLDGEKARTADSDAGGAPGELDAPDRDVFRIIDVDTIGSLCVPAIANENRSVSV